MKIEKGIPIPTKKYPFAEMEVGDSIFFEGKATQSSPVQMAYMHGKNNNKKFTAKLVDGGVRVWRVE